MEQGSEIIYETLQWTDGPTTTEYLVTGNEANLVYLAENGETVELIEDGKPKVEQLIEEDYAEECEVTEEVITTDEWVQNQGEDCVIQVTVDDIGATNEEDVTVPLPEAQDEYTASRPYPCDFCSRRFRKKANLMNHMIAHQNDRPHVCNLCGARYIRKSDLLNHLKTHAYNEDGYSVDESELVDFIEDDLGNASAAAITIEDLMLTQSSHSKPPPQQQKRLPKHSSRTKGVNIKPKKKQKKPKQTQSIVVDESSYERYLKLPPRFTQKDPNKPFICQFCGVCFARSKALNSHIRLHAGEVIWTCNECDLQFWNKNALNEHKEQHIVITKEEPIDTASFEFDDEATVTGSETEYHEDGGYIEEESYDCKRCDLTFNTLERLERHQLNHSVSIEEDSRHHCCNVCGETFAEALDLLAHAEMHARDHQAHQCLLCGDRFAEESAVKSHINEQHRNEMTDTTCRICGKMCKDGRSLMRHSWDHSSQRSHSCSRCGKSFQNKARLKRHMVSHKNKSVVCEQCGDEFPDGRSLMNHRHAHTKALQFHCSICGKSFGSRSSQQIHLRYHTGERPYACRYCWKSFADGGTLRKHERIHTGEKPYACPVCPRAFNQRVVLREHIRSHHSVQDTKNGTPTAPYYCTVCGDVYSSSAELVNHLIEHSDNNTAARRQMPAGPRKYKRRRSRPDDVLIDVGTTVTVKKDIEEELATFTFRKSVPKLVKLEHEDFRLPEEILMEVSDDRTVPIIEKLQNPITPNKKAKMIHTKRAQSDVKQPKNKTTITPKLFTVDDPLSYEIVVTATNIKSESFPLLDDGKPLAQAIEYNETQNDFLLDIVNKTNYSDKFDSDIVNDLKEILQSPVKRPPTTSSSAGINAEPTGNGRPRRSIKPTLKVVESRRLEKELSKRSNNKKENNVITALHTCQVCEKKFISRQELMSHIQIHI